MPILLEIIAPVFFGLATVLWIETIPSMCKTDYLHRQTECNTSYPIPPSLDRLNETLVCNSSDSLKLIHITLKALDSLYPSWNKNVPSWTDSSLFNSTVPCLTQVETVNELRYKTRIHCLVQLLLCYEAYPGEIMQFICKETGNYPTSQDLATYPIFSDLVEHFGNGSTGYCGFIDFSSFGCILCTGMSLMLTVFLLSFMTGLFSWSILLYGNSCKESI